MSHTHILRETKWEQCISKAGRDQQLIRCLMKTSCHWGEVGPSKAYQTNRRLCLSVLMIYFNACCSVCGMFVWCWLYDAFRPHREWRLAISCTVHLKCDGTRWRTGGEVKGNWRMEWVASTLHTISEHGVSSITTITTADAHTSAASSRLNWSTPTPSI